MAKMRNRKALPSPRKYVYLFGGGRAEGRAEQKDLLGGKGANLHEMTRLGIPVPSGFTITTEVCTYYYAHGCRYPKDLERQVKDALRRVERIMGKRFGDPNNPLLVSVRSGARASMPGMMDTILNLGLNDRTVEGLSVRTGNPRLAYDAYRRLVQMYGDVVLGLKPTEKHERDPFQALLESTREARGVTSDAELSAEDLRGLVTAFTAEIKTRCEREFPEDPYDQLWGAIGAVFGSWNNDRALAYRELYHIPHTWGTAVTIQAMVFGNMGETSATGVAFTRNPATGEKRLYGEFLVNAQGEDVVAGIRTPRPIAELKEVLSKPYGELERTCRLLEKHFRDMQDVEFTIEDGRLWMLQTRSGKRTGFAAVRAAVEMVGERIITRDEALLRVEPDQLTQLLRPIFNHEDKQRADREGRILTHGLPAAPGAATGRVVFHAKDAEAWVKRGEKVILCRIETSPEDIRGMSAAEGILTARGGMTSHAALVARQMGKVSVVGCEALTIDYAAREMRVKGTVVREGDWLSLDGTAGEVIQGALTTIPSEVVRVMIEKSLAPKASRLSQQFAKLMKWADEVRIIGIRTNADLPDQARMTVAFGAEGIGLCRTEHMFFEANRIDAMRRMIVAGTSEERRAALTQILPMQREDFRAIFEVMEDRPVVIRTLDPPLHEFLPKTEAQVRELAPGMGVSPEVLWERVESLREVNPMLGYRGCRLGISFPEITEMQARAIFEAACLVKKGGKNPLPEIMIPLVATPEELRLQREVVDRTAREVFREQGVAVRYLVGTMIELPRACLVADQIASHADFFSFGTNDLTQTCLGLSRDDAGKFLPSYVKQGILPEDPFITLDEKGVGELMRIGIERGRRVRKRLEIGICGEHGGEPRSVILCHNLGLDYVSCSPYRVPVAKLAAAHAALGDVKRKA